MLLNSIFWIGVTGFILSFIWWIIELILNHITNKNKHFDRMMIACAVFNSFNIIVQISGIIIRNLK